MKENKKERGITLVALIVTIIVLIILAAISIKAIMDFGIVKLATDSTEEYEGKQQQEKNQMDNLEKLLENAIDKIYNAGEEEKPNDPETTELEVTLTTVPKTENSFTMLAKVTGNKSEVAQYDFYVNGKIDKTVNTSEKEVTHDVTGITMRRCNV